MGTSSKRDGSKLMTAVAEASNGVATVRRPGARGPFPGQAFAKEVFASRVLLNLALAVLGSTPCSFAQTLIAVDDVLGVPFAQDLVVEAPGVLANDTYDNDPAEDAGATVELVSDVSYGFLSCESDPAFDLCPDGSFIYTPGASFQGTDTFTYEATVLDQTSQATVTLTACEGGPGVFVCWHEVSYLTKVGELGYGTITEGFEDDAIWDSSPSTSARDPSSQPSVISRGVKWETNHPAPPASNEITTGVGPARTGLWGVFDPNHGYATGTSAECNIDNPPVACLFKDGFTGTREPGESTLYGVGGYFTGSAQPNLAMILDGGIAIGLGKMFVAGHQFFGVIDTGGFTSFRVEETDGKIGQERYVFGDDFVFATTPSDTTPPQVTLVNSYPDTGDGEVMEIEEVGVPVTQLLVSFSELVSNEGGETAPHSVTNPLNYLLFSDGGDGFSTVDCATGVDAGDSAVAVDWATYVSGSEQTAALDINGGVALPSGAYRLLVCGTTSIKDWAGNPLDGDGNGTGGDDFARNFTVNVNDAPVAVDDSVTTVEGGTVTVLDGGALSVLDNDSDAESDLLTAILVVGPANAAAFTLNPDGTFSHTHDGSETINDQFTYKANDGLLDSNVATVSIVIAPVNDAPVADSQAVVTDEDTGLGIILTASDTDSPTLSYSVVAGPAHGTLSGAPPNVSYQPAVDYNGPDSFTFKANDDAADSNVATVSITIAPVNDAPVANDQAVTTDEDTALAITLTGTDVDSTTLTYSVVAGPTHGTLSGTGASRSYQPAADYNGPDSFTFKANDTVTDSNVATVSITVNAINDAPVATPDSYSTDEGGTIDTVVDLLPGVLANDTDAEDDGLTAILVIGPANASSFTLNSDGSFYYTHDGSQTVVDTFTYKSNDGLLDSNVVTVTITVAAVNDAPVAVDDSVTTVEGGTVTVLDGGALSVLDNDSDAESDLLTAILVVGPANASSFTLNSDGTFSYTHDGSETISDGFTYKANDSLSDSNIALVSITIGPINDAPVANSQAVVTDEDTGLGIILTASDTDSPTLSYSVVAGPAHGTLSGAPPNVSYQPAVDYNGPDSFTFKANDGAADSNVATVSITIAPVNDAPVANDQAVTTDEDTALAITLTGTDVDSTTLTYSVVSGPSHGVLSGAPPALSYLPSADYNGPDSFTFKANDGADDSNVATVSITVTAVNDAPVANPDSYSTDEGGTIDTAVDLLPGVLANDSDVESDPLTAILVSGPASAVSFTLNPDGSFYYTHDGGQTTTDAFTYKANDTLLDSNTTTVTIVINPVVTLPSLSIDDVSVLEGNAGTVEMLFTLSLSPSSLDPVEVDFVSSDGSATAGSDFGAVSGRAVFPVGVTTQTVTVMISGDTEAEGDETLYLNLANPLGAELGDDQGVGTIENDDPWTWFAAPEGNDFNSCLSPAAPCLTIQAAVDKASSGDSVRVAPGTYLENVWIGIDLVLIAEVAGQSVIDGGGTGTALTVAASIAVTISGLEIINGGVGGVSSLGSMTLVDCWVHHNGDGLTGSFGGISNQAISRIERCTISENTGTQEGGISNFGQLEVINSTISGNAGRGVTNGGTLSLEACSVVGNGSFGISGGGQTSIRATIISGHSAGNCDGPVISLGHNLEDLDDCSFDLGMGDIFGSDPMLRPLADNGGPTPTHRPMDSSPAIDSGPESVFPASDQRGFVRPVDGDLDGVATSDIGAIEVLPPDPSPLFQDGFEGGSTIEWSNTSP